MLRCDLYGLGDPYGLPYGLPRQHAHVANHQSDRMR